MTQLTLLSIRDLEINEDDEHYADGVALVRTYWAFSLEMTQRDRETLRSIATLGDYEHTASSRRIPSNHRLYKNKLGASVAGWMTMRTLYKTLPDKYIQRMTAKGIVLPTRDRTERYFELVGDANMPKLFNMDTQEARQYKADYPNLRQTPTTFRRPGAIIGNATVAMLKELNAEILERGAWAAARIEAQAAATTAQQGSQGRRSAPNRRRDRQRVAPQPAPQTVAAARREGRAEGRAETIQRLVSFVNAASTSINAATASVGAATTSIGEATTSIGEATASINELWAELLRQSQ